MVLFYEKTFRKITAVLLAMILCCSCFLSVASAGSQYGDATYVLLGDSVASGYNDSDNRLK